MLVYVGGGGVTGKGCVAVCVWEREREREREREGWKIERKRERPKKRLEFVLSFHFKAQQNGLSIKAHFNAAFYNLFSFWSI